MRIKAGIFNAVIFAAIAVLTYAATMYFDRERPSSVVAQPQSVVETVEGGDIAPDFSFTALDGKTHALRDFRGRAVILNFWASWCPPCVKEFPALLEVAAAFPDDVVLIALSSDLDQAAMEAFLKKQKYEARPNVYVALDENQAITQKLFQSFRLPETVLLDREQKPRRKIPGADWSVEEMTEAVRDLLAARNPSYNKPRS